MTAKQLENEIQRELTLANELVHSIRLEVEKIKQLTCKNGPFSQKVKETATILRVVEGLPKVSEKLEKIITANENRNDHEHVNNC